MFQNFLIKKMLKNQGVPEAQIEVFMNIIEKNPELFKQIAKEIEEKVKGGMGQKEAGLLVMKAHEAELRKLI